jgi:uncharacterized protein YfcZ (UPF0381/DUF406 family)
MVPWDDVENFDIWTINESATMKDTWVTRTNGIFQLHPRSIWDNPNNKNDPHHGEWLKANTTVPVFMLEKYPDVPMAEKFPLDEISEKYLSNLQVFSPRNSNRFYSCTVSYMAALALWKGYTEVDIYGVELSVDSEYRYQRPGAAFWIGLLCQHAKVRFFGLMLDAPLYGFEAEGEVSKEMLEEHLKAINPRRAEGHATLEPKRQVFEAAYQRFFDTGVEQENMIKAWQEFTSTLNSYGLVEGIGQELENRIKEIDKMLELDKDFRFSHHGFMRTAEALEKELAKVGHRHAYLAGIIDYVFSASVANRLHDSKRQAALKEFRAVIPEFVQLCQKIGIYHGALQENHLLARTIAEQKEGTTTNDSSE